ncbi:MAG: LytTR family transcriptional regulator DNA-binding domain-containing protein, partial [Lachnobacterium sp.]|nr:LytTR family transcriptional regulator DNA-binding domain-containing protein [Lachnobacterium sp.]
MTNIFLKINSGTIVNVAFIKGISNKEVVMDNGDILSLSRSNSKNVRNAVK